MPAPGLPPVAQQQAVHQIVTGPAQYGAPSPADPASGLPPVRTHVIAPAIPPAARPAPAAPPPAPAAVIRPVTASADTQSSPKGLKHLLRMARHWGCSDLHVSAGRPPFVRLNGELRYMEMEPLSPEQAEDINFSMLAIEQRKIARETLNLDFALTIPKLGRHRCNIFKQRLGWDGSYRIVPAEVPTIESLKLPPVLKMLTEFHQGMVLVTGPGRSGKTATLAALLDFVNSERQSHIITVEDPIEHVHAPKKCQVTQREIGPHSESFAMALRAALREDPDIILVGEMRDYETISIAITASETGHLVLGTLHTGSAARTISRILDVYPSNQQAQIATMISESLRGVVSQQLIPRLDGQGLILALEILIVTQAVGALIRDGKTHQLATVMQSGRRQGMQTMDDALMELVQSKQIAGEEAFMRAENKAAFEMFAQS
ncbi:PilT/PilU family type 4a pilus ATPase [Candidatus Poribacteria bacterium]|nr:PilT/PilU family type 4a pilus ATPase [Candidatus Poribacteria bacterium]